MSDEWLKVSQDYMTLTNQKKIPQEAAKEILKQLRYRRQKRSNKKKQKQKITRSGRKL